MKDGSAVATDEKEVDDCIKDGDVVVFDINHGFKVQFVTVSPSGTFQMGRTVVRSSALIGYPYGTLFEVDEETDELKAVPYVAPPNEWKEEDHAFERLEGHTTSSGITWSPSNQKLDNEEIRKLQESGVRGTTLVKKLESHSKTFEDRTVLAQKKFRKKKERKHVLVGCARRPTTKTLSEAYYTPQNMKRIGHLRPDSLAMALCLANVAANQRVLVIEQSAGLVAGAVMERLGGYGECCVGHVGKNAPNLSIVDLFHFDERVQGVLTHRSLLELLEEVKGLDDRSAQFTFKGKRYAKEEAAAEARKRQRDGAKVETEDGGQAGERQMLGEAANVSGDGAERADGGENGVGDGGENNKDEGINDERTGTDNNKNDNNRVEHEQNSAPKHGRFTSLIITATNFSQKSLLLSALPLLAPSASFAVVSPTLQPLVDTMNFIRIKGYAVGMVINEPWLRTIQVLPKRTHPDMSMNHGGGYILSGIVTKRGRWVNLEHFRAERGGVTLDRPQ